jgi:hypothetical protein
VKRIITWLMAGNTDLDEQGGEMFVTQYDMSPNCGERCVGTYWDRNTHTYQLFSSETKMKSLKYDVYSLEVMF